MRYLKLTLLLLTAFALLLSFTATALSDDSEASEPPEDSETESYETIPGGLYSEAYVVMDSKTGQVLVEKNMNEQLYPASITKILTVALALQYCDQSEIHTMSAEAVRLPANSSHIALLAGEEISVRDLAYAAILPSANDAANGLGEHVAQKLGLDGLSGFAELMNQTAEELGAVNSHFVNASGLPDDEHVTTAYDMALITKYALGVDGFREVFGRIQYTIQPTNLNEVARNIGTQHYMIAQSIYYYEGATGGKLGWTSASKCTCVTVANRGDRELICVSLKTNGAHDKYEDTTKLFDYCFDNFEYVSVSLGNMSELVVPVVENSITTGQITSDGSFTMKLLLHKAVANNDILSEYAAPEFYPSAESVKDDIPTVKLELDGDNVEQYMYAQLGTYQLDYSYSRVESDFSGRYAAAVRPIDNVPTMSMPAKVFLIIASIIALLIIGLFIVRAINLRRYRSRKLGRYSNRSKYIKYRD